MKKLFHFKLKKNILVLMMIVCLCPVLSVSYAAFVFNTGEYRASEMYIGKLLYGMKINNEAVSEITVSPGNTEVVIEVTSLNEIGSNYKLVYESNDNLLLRYANDENEPSYGLITTTKTSTILISNTSNEDITVKFNIVGGYKTNDLSEITIPNTYAEITGDYTKYDFSIMSMYVDNVLVEELDSEKKYSLVDYSCTNGETITWDKSTNTIVVTPLTNQTKCSVYFEEKVTVTLYEKILTAETPQSDENIDFAQISSDTNGKGLYYTSDLSLTEDYDGDGTGERVYYYRGAVTNNNVRFGGFCWRIVRTNEDGSVRLRYNGTYSDGTCPVTSTSVKINNTGYPFCGQFGDSKYNEYIWEDGTGESSVKPIVDQWYISSGLANYEDKIANVPYCADKSNPTKGSSDDVHSTYGLTYYGASNRFLEFSESEILKDDAQPTYKCMHENGKHTVSGDTWGGTGKLIAPIALLTADEVAFAGGLGSSSNQTYYLYTGEQYWTMSPYAYKSLNGGVGPFFIDGYDGLLHGAINSYIEMSVLPVISLKAEVNVTDTGDGSYTNPYVVEGSDFNVISFSVGDVIYYAQEGMTYYDWALSGYAPTEYNEYYSSITVNELYLFREPTTGQYFEDNDTLYSIYSSSTIVDGTSFILTNTPSYPY